MLKKKLFTDLGFFSISSGSYLNLIDFRANRVANKRQYICALHTQTRGAQKKCNHMILIEFFTFFLRFRFCTRRVSVCVFPSLYWNNGWTPLLVICFRYLLQARCHVQHTVQHIETTSREKMCDILHVIILF